MTRPRATAIGFTAILLWSLLALFTIGSAPVPPFLLNALCFGIGGSIGLIWTLRDERLRRAARVSLAGLCLWHRRAFRLSLPVFHRPAHGPPGRDRADRLSLAAVHRAVFRACCRANGCARCMSSGAVLAFAGAALIVLRGGRGIEAAALPGPGACLSVRADLGGLFGAVAPAWARCRRQA